MTGIGTHATDHTHLASPGIPVLRPFIRRPPPGLAQLLAEAVEAAANGIVITDQCGAIQWVNAAFTQMTGYSVDEVLGKSTQILKSGKHAPEFYRELWQSIQAGHVWRGTVCNKRKDGSEYFEAMTITPIRDGNGQVSNFIAIKEDISEKRRLEEQLRQVQKMEDFGQLAGGIAHDFNNLLTIISGYSEILLTMLSANDPKREAIQAITVAGAQAASLTRQLLAFSRKAVTEPTILDLTAVLREAEKTLRRLIGEDVLLTLVLDPNTAHVMADSGQLVQVVINLAVNARDAMPRGGTLNIATSTVEWSPNDQRSHPARKPGSYACIEVTDNGQGMTPEVQARIFEPFFTTKGVGKGTGLGLAVVHGIIQQSGGHIEVHSESNVGTTFRIYLPAAKGRRKCADESDDHEALRGTEAVLVVEDEDAVRVLAILALQSHGFRVLGARNGVDALLELEKHRGRIDLVVTDVVMPHMDGRNLVERLQQTHPEMQVLYTSGYTDDAVVRHGIAHAEARFLQKPYTPLSLCRKVREVLDATSRGRRAPHMLRSSTP